MLLLFTVGNQRMLRNIFTKYGQNSLNGSYLTREDTHIHPHARIYTQNMVISKTYLFPLKERN